MKKNYYEILEVDKNASSEVIEKAYKILIKKYHPDLQEDNNKQKYEELVKLLNEAYEILSDQEKRNQYDLELEEEHIKNQEINNINNYSNMNVNNVESNNNTNINTSYNTKNSQKANYDEQLNNAINKAYYDAYVKNLKNMGYSIKYKKTFKDYLIIFFTIIITFTIMFFIFQIPFVKNYFLDLYEENSAFRFIINIIKSIIDLLLNIIKRDS